jgi:uncharacterized protein DUF3987
MIDFNDFHVQHGLEKTRDILLKPAVDFFEGNSALNDSEIDSASISDDLLNPPPKLADIALYGVLKDVCKISTQYSEASPVAIAANTISTFSCMIGRRAFQHIGDGICHARPYFLLTGPTGKARKGTSEYTPRRIFSRIEDMLDDSCSRLKRHDGGLSTGEGLGWAIHDDIVDKDDVIIEEGIADKRLLVVEAEFAGAMAAASREKNNLSATIRTAWDGRTISPLVKNAKWAASDPHIVISGHITSAELLDRMSDVDAQSGFLNRFIILHIVRPKLVPLPKRTAESDIERVAEKLFNAVIFAGGQENNKLEVVLSQDAIKYWCGQYRELTKEHDGISGSLLVRTEIYCRMLAMIFALMDQTAVIEPKHIEAALAWIDYWKQSVRYIFQTLAARAESERLNDLSKDLHDFIKQNQGCSQTRITKHFKNKKTASEITQAINFLLNAAPPLIVRDSKPRADGRPGKGSSVFFAK